MVSTFFQKSINNPHPSNVEISWQEEPLKGQTDEDDADSSRYGTEDVQSQSSLHLRGKKEIK